MTKQEEIKKGLYQLARETKTSCIYGDIIEDILNYLHSQGCVLKVDRELPNIATCEDYALCREFCHTIEQLNMLKAGYVAIEPLIKE